MAEQGTGVFQIKDVDGTSDRTFRATGIGERWHSNGEEEQGDVFTKDKFEEALKKVSRKVKK